MNNIPILTKGDVKVLTQQIQLLIKAAIEKRHPTLKEQVDVSFEYRADIFFRARRCDGGRVMLKFGIGPVHPRFKEMLEEAGRACSEIRFSTTHATEVRHVEYKQA